MTSLRKWFRTTPKPSRETPSIYLLDGGVSTHLRDLHGQDFQHNELWSSSLLLDDKGRDTILQGHKDWLESGSNILTTVTYQCHSTSGKIIDNAKMEELLKQGVKLAQSASATSQQQKYVVASMGCYGAMLADGSEYTGNYPNIKCEQDLMDFHRRKTEILLQQNPDGIALETVPCVQEVRAFVSLWKQLQTKSKKALPACWISLACRNGQELNDGSKLQEALKAVDELDPTGLLIQAVGINCCHSEHVQSLVQILVQHSMQQSTKNHRRTPRGIVIYPNSGEEWDAETKTWKEGTGLGEDALQDVFATRLMEAVAVIDQEWTLGPRPRIVLGGCCRTRPETVRALRTQVDEYEESYEERSIQAVTTVEQPPPPPTNMERDDVSSIAEKSSHAPKPEPMTPEQQEKLAAILGRDADFDKQLGELGNMVVRMHQTQQLQTEAIDQQLQKLGEMGANLQGLQEQQKLHTEVIDDTFLALQRITEAYDQRFGTQQLVQSEEDK